MNMDQMNNDIAIVGMGCRLPGDVKSISQFWELLESGLSTQSDVPANRFDIGSWYHPDPKRHGSIASRGGYFLSQDDSYRQFDPSFFGINPLEARSIDPQQRKLLEVVYETFESAGVTLSELSGSRTACYVGCFTHDYSSVNSRDAEDYIPYSSTGADMTVLSNRINYVFNLKGPSLTVDTACSSSLYALHLACQGLRAGDYSAAIVAGTSIIMDVRHQIVATKLGILSPTATCHVFDEAADGFGRAEGITVLYIKRLSDAIRDKDPIRAVIRESAINTNGRGHGITQPGVVGQTEVIRQAYNKAGLDLQDTAFVECHGTGTPVGDPIEVQAIGECFTNIRTADKPLLLSALKSQIGHTEGASGIAGVQKVVLSMEQDLIPATVGISNINPNLNLRNGKLRIVRQLERWPSYHNYKRAGVNSFGYGGANAHVIIDDTDSFFASHLLQSVPKTWTLSRRLLGGENQLVPRSKQPDGSGSDLLLVTSAHSSETLQQNIDALITVIDQDKIADLAYTLGVKRTHYHHRAFGIKTSDTEGKPTYDWKSGARQSKIPCIAFVFTGQGAQWPRMGIELIESYDIVRQTFTELQRCLDTIPERPDWTLHQALYASQEDSLMMKDVAVSVTLCSAIQVALVDLLRSWSVEPTAVVGHSSGEAAAAYCAGYLSRSQAIITSYYRAFSMKRNPQPGLMMAVGVGAAQAQPLVSQHDDLYVACHNSPQSATIAGVPCAVQVLEKELHSRNTFARIIKSSGFANHCPLVQRAADYFLQNFSHSVADSKSVPENRPSVPFYSCITGGKTDAARVDAKYWSQNIAAPVLFDEALQELLRNEPSVDLLIELGPHSALAGPIRQVKELLGGRHKKTTYLSTLTRGSNGVMDMLKLAGNLFTLGYPVNLSSVNSANNDSKALSSPNLIVDLPSYQWTYSRTVNISEQRIGNAVRFRKHPRHDLLGSQEPTNTPDILIWRNRLSLMELPWIKDHLIGTSILFPTSGYVAMAIEATKQYAIDNDINSVIYEVSDMKIARPLVLLESSSVEIIFEMIRCNEHDSFSEGHENFTFKVSSVSSESHWIQYVSGKCAITNRSTDNELSTTDHFVPVGQVSTKSFDVYSHFSTAGLRYGRCFQTLTDVKLYEDSIASANINLYPTKDIIHHESSYQVHPATMDGCLQAAFAASSNMGQMIQKQRAYLPKEIPQVRIYHQSTRPFQEIAQVYCKLDRRNPHSIDASFSLINSEGICMMSGGVTLVAADGISASQSSPKSMPEPYQRIIWRVDLDQLNGRLSVDELASMTFRSNEYTRQKYATRAVTKSSSEINRNSTVVNGVGNKPNMQLSPESVRGEALSSLIHLIAFKYPHSTYLEIGTNSRLVPCILQSLRAGSRHPWYKNLMFLRDEESQFTEINTMLHKNLYSDVMCSRTTEGIFDVMMVTGTNDGLLGLKRSIMERRKAHNPNGMLLLACPETTSSLSIAEVKSHLTEAGYPIVKLYTNDMSIVLAQAGEDNVRLTASITDPDYWIVYRQDTQWVSRFLTCVCKLGVHIRALSIRDIEHLPKGARTVSLLEVEQPMLSCMDEHQMTAIQRLLETASSVTWVYGSDPQSALMPGMVRTLTNEMTLADLKCIRIDASKSDDHEHDLNILVRQLFLTHQSMNKEEHSIIQNGKTMIMRHVIDETSNLMDLAQTEGIVEQGPCKGTLRLATSAVGQTDSFEFIDDNSPKQLSGNQIMIEPLVYSMNSQNKSTLTGQFQGRWLSHGCFGKVQEAVDGAHISTNKFVLHLGGTGLGTEELVESDLCVPCSTEAEGRRLVTYVEPICTAYYALAEVANVRKGQRILVNSKDDILISILRIMARHFGADVVLATTGVDRDDYIQKSHARNDFRKPLVNGVNGISRPARFTLLIDTVGDLEPSKIVKHIAPNSRLIYTGSVVRNVVLSTEYDSLTRKGASISYLDIMDLAEREPTFTGQVLTDAMELAKELNLAAALPQPRMFSLGDVSQAINALSSSEVPSTIGLVCDRNTTVPIRRLYKPSFKLRSDGTYLLVGCLGGLGRSISSWMLEHGARHFIFLSRSGMDKSEARALVEQLQSHNDVTVQVVRGDVTVREDVYKAVASARLPLRGVIQAATVFDECHFKSMNPNRFNKVIRPKVHGTVFLHEATLDQPLDFFVMTSSSVGITGATTQSHYTAGNGFLDAFARHRRELGLPACSLSLGMVVGIGHVEDAGIEELLRRRGSYGISEAEFLRMMELACSSSESSDPGSMADILHTDDTSLVFTGLDPTRVADFVNAAAPDWLEESSALSHIKQAILRLTPQSVLETPSSSSVDDQSPISALRKLLDNQEDRNEDQTTPALQLCIVHQLSSLVHIPVSELDESLHKPLSDLGMDSIISADFQAWARRELRVSIDFMEMLAGNQTVRSLIEIVRGRLK